MTRNLQETVFRFAAEQIASRNMELQTAGEFPHDIWQKMGEAGLFGIGIEDSYGGSGGGYSALVAAGEAMAQGGHNMGLAMSWLYQQIVASFFIRGFGNDDQRREYLGSMARGCLTTCIAVSEPKHGAHPKHLATLAQKDGPFYIVNGEKTYLTNGPIAGLYIVIAVTDNTPLQRQFTAFLVPRETDGLTVSPPMIIPFLKPSTHGGILLTNCRLPESTILGEVGTAYRRLVIPFGGIEDALMLGPVTGGMAAQLDHLLAALRERGAEADPPLQGELGTLAATLEALRVLARDGAKRLDRGEMPSPALAIASREWTAAFQTRLAEIISRWGIAIPEDYNALTSDLSAMTSIRRRVLQIKREKLGASLLKETG